MGAVDKYTSTASSREIFLVGFKDCDVLQLRFDGGFPARLPLFTIFIKKNNM